MRKNPSKQQHAEYAKYAIKNAKAHLKVAEAATDASEQANEAVYAVIEATRAYWNAYDAGDGDTAQKATKIVAKAQGMIVALTGVELGPRQKGPQLEGELFHTHMMSNPYQGDAVEAARRRKYGYPKPPTSPRGNPRMTKRDFEQMFQEEILPMVARRYETDGVPDKPARRETWNDMVDAYVQDGVLPRGAINWSHPRWLETARIQDNPKVRRAEKKAPKKNPSKSKRSGGSSLLRRAMN